MRSPRIDSSFKGMAARLGVAALLLALAARAGAAPKEPAPFEIPKDWKQDWTSAVTEAKKTGKPILGCFGQVNCDTCVFAFEQIANDPAVKEQAANWVVLFVDAENPSAKDQFHVEEKPVLVLFSPDGVEQDRVPNIRPAAVVAKILMTHKARMARMAEIKAQIAKTPGNASLYADTGDLLMDHAVFYPGSKPTTEAPLEAYKKAAQMDPALREKLADKLYFLEAVSLKTVNLNSFKEMKARLDKFEEKFPKSSLLPSLPLYQFFATVGVGAGAGPEKSLQPADILAIFKKGLERFPKDEMAEYCRMYIRMYEAGK